MKNLKRNSGNYTKNFLLTNETDDSRQREKDKHGNEHLFFTVEERPHKTL